MPYIHSVPSRRETPTCERERIQAREDSGEREGKGGRARVKEREGEGEG